MTMTIANLVSSVPVKGFWKSDRIEQCNVGLTVIFWEIIGTIQFTRDRSVATGGARVGTCPPCHARPCWVMGFSDSRRSEVLFFLGGGVVGERWRPDSAANLRRKAFDSCKLYVCYGPEQFTARSSFWPRHVSGQLSLYKTCCFKLSCRFGRVPWMTVLSLVSFSFTSRKLFH